jgi:hypothetical protein
VLRRPIKTAVGVWGIGLLSALTLYALNEILSASLSVPIDTMNFFLGSIVIVAPLAVAVPFYVILSRHAKETSAQEG